jgi:hypothetical protein
VPVKLLWAVASEEGHIWDLKGGLRYGRGTTYEGGFWHAFMIRHMENQKGFVARMEQMMRDGAAS